MDVLIINFSSISGNGAINQSAYAAAKAGVKALTSTWSKELSIFNIRTACISPGIVDSESTKKDLKINHVEGWKKQIPLGRFATLNEIYYCVDFILKNDYFYMCTCFCDKFQPSKAMTMERRVF